MKKPSVTRLYPSAYIFYIVLISIIIVDACRKIDVNHDKKLAINYATKFFDIPAATNPTIRRLAEAMKAYNDKNDYVSSFAKKHGFPKWDKCPKLLTDPKSTHRGNEGGYTDTIAFVPITNSFSGPSDAERVVSFLAARLTADSIEIRLFNTDEYMGYGFTDDRDTLSAETIALMSMYLERVAVADRDTFRITDDRLFSSIAGLDSARLLFIDTSTTGGSHDKGNLIIPIETTECVTFCGHFGLRAFKNATDEGCATITVCYDTWNYLIEDEPGLILTGGAPGGGGNGGGTGGLGSQVNCTLYPQGVCGQTPFLGWIPLNYDTEAENNYLNRGYRHFKNWLVSPEDEQKTMDWYQDGLDTTGLDTCIRKVLDKILLGNTKLGNLLAKLERGVFKGNNIDKFQLTFKVQDLIFEPNKNAKTTIGRFDNGTGIYYDTIIINQRVADSATELGIAKTIIHETIHAYLNAIYYRWFNSSFNPTQISSMSYDTLFTKYIDSMIVINTRQGLTTWISNDPEKDHSFMADQCVNLISQVLKSVDNGRNSDEFYWLFAWSGLYQSRTMHYYWPNFPSRPPSNPVLSNDSTRGLKYAFTIARLDSMINYEPREYLDTASAKGRRHIPGSCF